MVFLAGVLVTALVLLVAELLFEFSRGGRTALSLLSVLLFLCAGSWMIGRPLLRLIGILPSATEEATARFVGAYFPSIRDRLLNALQLAKNAANDSTMYSAELIDESLKNLAEEMQPLDLTTAVDTSHLPRYRRWLTASTAVLMLALCLFPASFSGAAYRLIHCTQEFAPPAKYFFEISPGNKEVVKGETVAVRMKITSLLPAFAQRAAAITVYRRQEGQENVDEISVKPDSSGIYHTVFQSVRSSTEYFARIADAESEHFTLTVVDRPLIRSFHVKLDYPAYTKISQRVQDEFIGDITALAGTRVTISGSASKLLQGAFLQFGNATTLPMIIQGDKFSASFSVLSDNSYHISVVDGEGLSNNEPVQYQIKAVPDEPPVIAIVEPGRNIDITGDQQLNLYLQAKDDFGFSSLRLGYRLVSSRYEKAGGDYSFTSIPLPADAGSQIELPFIWNLTGLHLVPEDVVEYFAEVFDNDAVKGPKSGRSNLYLLRLPSLDEFFADVDKEHDRSQDDLRQSLEEARRLKQDIESINRDLKKNKDPDWQTRKKMEEMAAQYKDVQKKLDDVHRAWST